MKHALLGLLLILVDGAYAFWPEDGMLWDAKLSKRQSVTEVMEAACREQDDGLPVVEGNYVICASRKTILWSQKVK